MGIYKIILILKNSPKTLFIKYVISLGYEEIAHPKKGVFI